MALAEEQEIISHRPAHDWQTPKGDPADGTSAWWLTTKMPWRDKDGNIIGTFGVTRNVTELKEAEGHVGSGTRPVTHLD